MEAEHDPNAAPGQRGHMSKYQSPYGKREGLADRLQEHARRLATDKTTPWLGLGLYEDLIAAISALRGEPEEKPKAAEYDL